MQSWDAVADMGIDAGEAGIPSAAVDARGTMGASSTSEMLGRQ